MKLKALGALGLLLIVTAPLAAQDDAKEPWRNSWFPVISYDRNDGFGGGVEVNWTESAPWDAPYSHRGQVGLRGTISASGSYLAQVQFDAPGLSDNWRFDALGGAERDARFQFFGLGDTTTWNTALESGANPYYYRTDRRRVWGTLEASRRLHGHLWLAAAADYRHTTFDALGGNSVFLQLYGNHLAENDATGRLSLVLDTRDNQIDTRRGLLLEGSALTGSYGSGYQRYTADLRGWKGFGDYNTWWIDGRIIATGTSGTVPLDARFFIPSWEQLIRSYGGVETNRGLVDQRYTGRDVLLGNLKINRDLINAGLYGAISVHAFLDAGRVFENEGFSLTTSGMKVGGGGGVALRVGRTAIYTFNFGTGPDGFVFTLGSGWMF